MKVKYYDLENKRVFITGGGSGIGASIVEHFCEQGSEVYFIDIKVSEAEKLIEDIKNKKYSIPTFIECDLLNIKKLQKTIADIISQKGPIDILINNGAIIEPITSLGEIELQDFEKAVRVNYLAPSLLISYCWNNLLKNRGKVINVLSGASINAIEGWTAYCSTKAALHMINQQTHLEGNQYGISSIGLSPGMVDTDMQGKIRASGINKVSKVRKEDLINSKKTGLFALWCASSNANEFSGKMISESDQIVSAKYKAWINAQNLKL